MDFPGFARLNPGYFLRSRQRLDGDAISGIV